MKCDTCKGKGKIYFSMMGGDGSFQNDICSNCKGTGQQPVYKTCFGKNKADRECDPAIPPCPDCQKQEEVSEEEIRLIFEKESKEFQYYKSVCEWSRESHTYFGTKSHGIMHKPLGMLTGFTEAYKSQQSRITELSECNKLLREIWLTDVGKIAELEQQRDEALSIVKLACKAADYRKRHQNKLIYEEIEILKIMNERTADNRQEDE